MYAGSGGILGLLGAQKDDLPDLAIISCNWIQFLSQALAGPMALKLLRLHAAQSGAGGRQMIARRCGEGDACS